MVLVGYNDDILIELFDESTPTMLNKIYVVWIVKLGCVYMMKLDQDHVFLAKLADFSSYLA